MFTDNLFISKFLRKVPIVDIDACLTSLIFHFTSSRLLSCTYIKKDKVKIIVKIHTCINQYICKLINKVEVFSFILASDLCAYLIGMCNFLTCFVWELTWLMTF